MNKHKYFYRGIGVTLIITATIFYFLGIKIHSNMKKKLDDMEKLQIELEDQLTDEKIILKAKKLGMIFPANDKNNIKSHEEDVHELNSEKENYDNNSTVEIKIEAGMTSGDASKLLFDKGVITNTDECDEYLMINNIANKIKIGTYKFKLNSTYEDVLNIFTNKLD